MAHLLTEIFFHRTNHLTQKFENQFLQSLILNIKNRKICNSDQTQMSLNATKIILSLLKPGEIWQIHSIDAWLNGNE